jgi:excisionase family DNA binding protein
MKSIRDDEKVSPSEKFFDNRIPREWLPTDEAARYLGMTSNALRILVCRGRVKAYHLGRKLRFQLKDLNACLHIREV